MDYSYNGKTYSLSLTNVATMERLEDAFFKLSDADKGAPKDGRASALYRYYVDAFRTFFDSVLGAGAFSEMFGTEEDYEKCIEAYNAFCECIANDRIEREKRASEILSKYSYRRAKR